MNNFKSYKGSGQALSGFAANRGDKNNLPKYIQPYGKKEFQLFAKQPSTFMELFTHANYQDMSIIKESDEDSNNEDRSVQLSFISWKEDNNETVKHSITPETPDGDKYLIALQYLKYLIDPTDGDLAARVNMTVPQLREKNDMGVPQREEALILFLRDNIDFIDVTQVHQRTQTSEFIALNTVSLEYHSKIYTSGSHGEHDNAWKTLDILKSPDKRGIFIYLPLNKALKVWLAYLEFYKYFPMDPEKEWKYNLNGYIIPKWEVIAQKNGIDITNSAPRSVGTARYQLFLEYLRQLEDLVPIFKREQKTPEQISILALQNLLGDSVNTSQGDSKTDDVASEKKQEAPQQQSVPESLSLKDYSDSKYESLRTQLESYNLKIVPVADNGDCMFEAMSKFLIEQGIDVNTRDVRTIIVKHIADNWREYLDEIAVRGGCFNPSQTSGNDNDYRDWCHYPTKYQKVMMMEPNEQGQMPQGYPPQSRFGGASELAAFSEIEWGDHEKIFNFQLLIIGDNNKLLQFTDFDNDNIHRTLNLLLDQQNLHYSLLLPIIEAAEKNNEDDSVPPVVPLLEDRQREDESVVQPVVQSEQDEMQKNTDYLKFLQFFDGVNQHYITQSEAYKQSTEKLKRDLLSTPH